MADNKDKPIDLSSIENFEIEPPAVKNKVIQSTTTDPKENSNGGTSYEKRGKRSGQLKKENRNILKIAIKKG